MEYKENIETAIKTLEALVKKMADSREEIAENRIEKASESLNYIEAELQKLAGEVAQLKFKIENKEGDIFRSRMGPTTIYESGDKVDIEVTEVTTFPT